MNENKNDTTACGYRDGLINVILHGSYKVKIPMEDLEELSTEHLEEIQRQTFKDFAEEKNLDYRSPINKAFVHHLFFKEKLGIDLI